MKEFFYKYSNEKRNIFAKLYIHKIGQYRFNWHKTIEVMFILSGSVELCVEGKILFLQEGDLAIIDSNIGHATMAKELNSIAMVLQLDPIYFEGIVDNYTKLKFNSNKLNLKDSYLAKDLQKLLINLFENFQTNKLNTKILIESQIGFITSILIEMSSYISNNNTFYTSQNKSFKEKKIITYLEKNYDKSISLESLSKVLNFNPTYLSAFFKKNLGINFQEYLTRIRLREATIELGTATTTIAEIAFNNGFTNLNSFNSNFKKMFNQTPSSYRKNLSALNTDNKILNQRSYLKEDNEFLIFKLNNLKKNIFSEEIKINKDKNISLKNKEELKRKKEILLTSINDFINSLDQEN